jgi:SsrA-binding protein
METLQNKKAYFDYFVEDEYIAGIVLVGGEVKSIRNENVSLSDSFCYLSSDNEMMLKNSYIKLYENAGMVKYDERRERKLLLRKEELRKIHRFLKEKGKGYTIVPLSMFFNERGKCKVKIGICKGKKKYDKRESIKERDIDRQTKKEMD